MVTYLLIGAMAALLFLCLPDPLVGHGRRARKMSLLPISRRRGEICQRQLLRKLLIVALLLGSFSLVSWAQECCGLQVAVLDTDGNRLPDEPFYRRNEQEETTRGWGLGLARIAEQHGGKVEARSESGTGTSFRIRLPVTRLVLSEVHQ